MSGIGEPLLEGLKRPTPMALKKSETEQVGWIVLFPGPSLHTDIFPYSAP
jgi:hypothetical protein